MREEFERYLRENLKAAKLWGDLAGHVMEYGGICDHDSNHLCECRLNWIINTIKEEEINNIFTKP